MLNINLFIAAGVITSPAICLGIQERKKERKKGRKKERKKERKKKRKKERKKAPFHIVNTMG